MSDRNGSAVYFVLGIGANLVKIGWVRRADRFEYRLARIRTDAPFPVKVIHMVHGASRIDESRTLKRFMAVHQHGEWFRCEGSLKQYLQWATVEPEEASRDLLKSIKIEFS